MYISPIAIKAIKNNIPVQARLMLAFNVTGRTVENWIQNNSINLTTHAAMAIIKDETKLTETDILTSN